MPSAEPSLFRQAWDSSVFLSWSKFFGSVGIGLLTLVWNVVFGLRTVDAAKWFGVSVILAYFTFGIGDLVVQYAALWARFRLNMFLLEIKAGLTNTAEEAVRDAVQKTMPSPPPVRAQLTPFNETQLAKLREFLEANEKAEVSLVSQTGEPKSYEQLRAIEPIFKDCGWVVSSGLAALDGPGIFVFVNSKTSHKATSLICEALAASGIRFTYRELESDDFNICTIYFSHRQFFN